MKFSEVHRFEFSKRAKVLFNITRHLSHLLSLDFTSKPFISRHTRISALSFKLLMAGVGRVHSVERVLQLIFLEYLVAALKIKMVEDAEELELVNSILHDLASLPKLLS